nr:unnamed protein product [Naegleria fowleri]
MGTRTWQSEASSLETVGVVSSERKPSSSSKIISSKTSSHSKQVSSKPTSSGNQRKASPQTVENVLEQSKKNSVISQAKQKAHETTNNVDKLALETVILEEELKRLKFNIMKEKENWKNVPKQGIWKSSQKIRENISGQTVASPLIPSKPKSSQRESRPSSSSSSYNSDEGKIIKIRSSVTNFQDLGVKACNNELPPSLKTKPIPGTIYEEICEIPDSSNQQPVQKQTKLAEGEYDEALQQRLFQEAVRSWREGNSDAKIQESPATSSTPLRDGTYDEELQQKLFKDAVMAWRGEQPHVVKAPTSNAETSSDPFVEKKSSGLSMFQTEFVENLCNATRYTYFDKHFRK